MDERIEDIEELREFLEEMRSIGEWVDRSIDGLITALGHKLTYQEYIEITGESIDDKIKRECVSKNLVGYGGKAKINLVSLRNKKQEEAEFLVALVELYYKDTQDQWVKQGFKSRTSLKKLELSDKATFDRIAKFRTEGATDELNIDPPKI